MMLKNKIRNGMLVLAFMVSLPFMAQADMAQTEEAKMPTANPSMARELVITVLPFEVKNVDESLLKKMRNAITEGALPEVDTLGKEFANLLAKELTATHGLALVERESLDKIISEMGLGLSGIVDQDQAAKIGHMVGAKVIVTGRIFPVKRSLVYVAKIISVETGRVYGETITAPLNTPITEAALEMGVKIATTISNKQDKMMVDVSNDISVVDKLLPLVNKYAGKKLPVVSVQIEEKHINSEAIDPAAETEIAMLLQKLGFTVIDPLSSNEIADVKIIGEGFSEFAMRTGNLVSSKGRVELKVIKREDGALLLVDREVETAVELSVNIAGREALAKAASKLVERIVPILLEQATSAE